MIFTPYQIFIILLMVVTGSINTLSTKWADNMKAVGIDGGKPRPFNHPFLQACGMFLGEMTCLFAWLIMYYRQRRAKRLNPHDDKIPEFQRFNPFVLLPAAMLDMTGTSVMYVGLNMTYASSFQMLRGSAIIFTGLLSIIFLRRRLKAFHWIGIVFVMAGLAVVGVADIVFGQTDSTYTTKNIAIGDALILGACLLNAGQFVVEEKFISKHNIPPLLAVGFEGLFGFVILTILLIPMYFIDAGSFSDNPEHRLEDALDGFHQIGQSWELILAVVGNIISIAFFNFAGISITKEISATTRMVLDSVRTLVIWVVSLALSWESFLWLQIIGFLLLVSGMCVYNNILFAPLLRRFGVLKPIPDETATLTVAPPSEEIVDYGGGRTNDALKLDYPE